MTHEQRQPCDGQRHEPQQNKQPIHGPLDALPAAGAGESPRLAGPSEDSQSEFTQLVDHVDHVELRYGQTADYYRAYKREHRLAKRHFKAKLGKKEFVRQLRSGELNFTDFNRWLHPERHPRPTPEEQEWLDAWYDRFMRKRNPERYRRMLAERDKKD